MNITGAAKNVDLALGSTVITEVLATLDVTPVTVAQYCRTIIEQLALLDNTPSTIKHAIQTITEQLALLDTYTTQAAFTRTITNLIGLLGAHTINTSTSVADIVAMLESHTTKALTSVVDQIALNDPDATKEISHSDTELLALLDNTTLDNLINVFEKMGLLGSHLKDVSLTIEEKLEIVQAYATVLQYIQRYYASEYVDSDNIEEYNNSDHVEEHKDSDESEVER